RGPAADHGVAGGRSDSEDAGGTADDARDDGALDGPSPARAGPQVVALDEEDVRDALRPAPADCRLRGERAPARHDDDARIRVPQRRVDPRRDRVVVTEEAAHPGQTEALEEDGAVS